MTPFHPLLKWLQYASFGSCSALISSSTCCP